MKLKTLVLSFFGLLLALLFCFLIEPLIGYESVGLILMLPILIASFSGDLRLVILTGFLSALFWNFFFIPPKFQFSITLAQDKIMILTYFVVSVIMAFIANRLDRIKSIAESERLYRAIFDSVSHELKTPLTTIMGSASAILSENISSESKQILISEIADSSLRLENVINNLLDMSRIKSVTITPKKEALDIKYFFEDFVGRHSNLLKAIQVKLNYDKEELFVLADEGLLENVFLNIFRNSIRHGIDVKNIEISIRHNNAVVQITISDDGKSAQNIPLKNIFDPFFSTKKTESLGLGLSISKAFIEVQGGRIEARHPKVNKGFSISIELPYFNLLASGYKNENQ